jgi:hypothetical protein
MKYRFSATIGRQTSHIVRPSLLQTGETKVALQIEGVRCGSIMPVPEDFVESEEDTENVSKILKLVLKYRNESA